jgi:hypothetical protein
MRHREREREREREKGGGTAGKDGGRKNPSL